MKHLFSCRRTYLATLSIIAIAGLGLYIKDASVASALATVAVGIAGANAWEKRSKAD